ncbi:hypothetical protein VB735_34330 [Halotia wernerae UHCC 0503]|uniref:hypothetical protein n=1 Tax=Nostoc sp. UHCC 0252 TaxID=3110241 RepID=UPI002B1EF209|nr:hypothetical protein [Nostoc sp. UHCC 0252]MEA5508073.1 hypothetical protein [Halotia wernerae UHCC 0503]MEA5603201.1 hypothetical protein [Nostoc sp. UHCC 0252]
MVNERKPPARKRGAQLNVRLDNDLYVDYKELLDREGTSMTEDIENYIKSRLGKESDTNVIDIRQVIERQQQEIAEIKAELGKLKAG